MIPFVLVFIFMCFQDHVACFGLDEYPFCGNNTLPLRSCTTQILGQVSSDYDTCKVEYIPSSTCGNMRFSPINPSSSNAHIGGVMLRPAIVRTPRLLNINQTVLNITFNNIKWKTMKFRFQVAKYNTVKHCSNIVISNHLSVNNQSILYYDCYWPTVHEKHMGQSHIMDFEASDDKVVNRGQYLFNIPSAEMLSPTVTEEQYKPFLYIEILLTKLRLHIMPPPPHLRITAYHIQVIQEFDQYKEGVRNKTIKLKDGEEVTYDYSIFGAGAYYFVVTPIHVQCGDGEGGGICQFVESPKYKITISTAQAQNLNICIASVTALIVSALFAYYIVLRMIRRYCMKEYTAAQENKVPPPPKVLVIYPSVNRLHAECVAAFVAYLRQEGFEILYDGDIPTTSHGDPHTWALECFPVATHILYIAGPMQVTNAFNSIYEKPIITPYKDTDKILLEFLKKDKVSKSPKDVSNVLFEYSNKELPIVTMNDKVFDLSKKFKDWNKMVAHLSKDLIPLRHIKRTEKGQNFIATLNRATETLGLRNDVIIKCEKTIPSDMKTLL